LLVPATIAMVVVVPVWTFRYMVPLAPFIIGYVLAGLRTRSSDPWQLARVAVMLVIGFDLYDHARYTYDFQDEKRAAAIDWLADGREVDDLLAWMRKNLVIPGSVATTNPALVYLETGRKTVAIDDCAGQKSMWKAHGIRYLVALRPSDLPAPAC